MASSGLYVNPNTGHTQAGLQQFRNAIINGDMMINQRGTSTNLASQTIFGGTTGGWVVDRWFTHRANSQTNGAMVQGTNLSSSDLPFSDSGITTFARIGRPSGSSFTNFITLSESLESQESYKFANKTTNLSFYYRTGANFSGTTLRAELHSGTGIDQNVRLTGFTNVAVNSQNYTATLNWTRVSFNAQLPSNLTQIGVIIRYTPTGTALAADYFDITGVQLELGSVATPFEVRPFPVELQLCMRYYQKSYDINIVPGSGTAGVSSASWLGSIVIVSNGANGVFAPIIFPVRMRAIPQIIIYNPSTGEINTARVDGNNSSTSAVIRNVGQTGTNIIFGGSLGSFYYAQYIADAEL